MHANLILDPIFHPVLDPCLNTPEIEHRINEQNILNAMLAPCLHDLLKHDLEQVPEGSFLCSLGDLREKIFKRA